MVGTQSLLGVTKCVLIRIHVIVDRNCIGKGEVTIKLKDDDFMDMVAGKLTPQKVAIPFLHYTMQ